MARKIIRRAKRGSVEKRITIGWDRYTFGAVKRACGAAGVSFTSYVKSAVTAALSGQVKIQTR